MPGADAPAATILIVDDVAAHRAHLVGLLAGKGHRLLQARNGRDGLAVARTGPIDLVITDVLMPVMDGYEFVRLLRADPTTRGIPVLFYTAPYGEREAWAQARRDAVAYVLMKPAGAVEALTLVERLLAGDRRAAPSPGPLDFRGREQLELTTEHLSRTTRDLRLANARLRAVINIGLELASLQGATQLLDGVCAAARDLFGASYATLGIVDQATDRGHRTVVCGVDPGDWLAPGRPIPGILAAVVEQRIPARGINPGGDPTALGFLPGHPPVEAYLAVAVMSPTRSYGWICLVGNEGRRFSPDDEELLVVLASQIGRIYELDFEIHERRAAEAALHASQRLNTGLIEHLPHRILVKDRDSVILFCNANFARDLGRPSTEIIGQDAFAFYAPERAAAYHADDREVMAGGGVKDLEEEYQVDGKSRWVHTIKVPFLDEVGAVVGVIVVFEDITDRRRLEVQLRQSQKIEAVGRLAGGVAHDFNNLLTVILGHCEMLIGDLPAIDPVRADIDEIHKAGLSAAALTGQLLAFSRKQVFELAELDLNASIAGIQNMLCRLIPENVRIAFLLQPELSRVRADRGQIEQILMNLVVNARDAMAYGGVLTIATSEVELDENFPKTHLAVPPGQYVVLTVSDTGTGMTPEVQALLFEPFFTTKGVGQGTGLGLATVHGIVKQSGGSIEVYSEVGHGSSFRIYLPRSQDLAAPMPLPVPAALGHVGLEHLIVVDDESGIRALARRLLERRGYTVFTAANGAEAIRLLEEHRDIALLLTDVVMPGESGPELNRTLRARHPGLRVVYMSGYTEDAILQHGVLHQGMSFLHKPFTSESLARKVRETLDRPMDAVLQQPAIPGPVPEAT